MSLHYIKSTSIIKRTAKKPVCKDEKTKGDRYETQQSGTDSTLNTRTVITILVIPAQIPEQYEPVCKAMLVEEAVILFQ